MALQMQANMEELEEKVEQGHTRSTEAPTAKDWRIV